MTIQRIRAAVVRAALYLSAVGIASPHQLAAQRTAGADTTTVVRVVGAVGSTIIHLPAFTYTKGSSRTPVLEPAQEGGGLAFTGGLEALRGRRMFGARYQFVVAPLTDNWSAHVGAAYAGVARQRRSSVLSAALGATVVHREQVTRDFAPNICFYAGCENNVRVNRDGGTITTGGVLVTAAAEWRILNFGGDFRVGVEGVAASGPQRYAGIMLRLSIGLP